MTYLQIQLAAMLCVFRHMRTVQISNCANNKVEIFEDAPVPVTCGGIVSAADVTWRRDGVFIGECAADGTSCTVNLYNDYSLSRSPQSTESRLTLLPEYRRHAGVTVSCTDTVSTASCTLVIRRHPVLSECDVTTNTVSENVSGSCRVQGAYSSDSDSSCSWSVNNQQSFGGFDSAREMCSFTQPLPQVRGLYTYTIAVFPPSTAGFSQTVTIAVQIYNCTNNEVEIFEDAPVPVMCAGIASNLAVTWRRSDGVLIGECDGYRGCCTNNLYNDYSPSRSPQSTESRLTLLPEYRRHAGVTVSCTDSVSTASCTLVIRRHPVLSECNVTTNTVSGSVSGSCRVQGAYSSDNDYSCRWSVNNQQSFGGFDSARESCSFTQPLPQDSGLYTYTIAVFPPSTAGFSQTVRIERVPAITTSATWSATVTAAIVGTVVSLMVLITAVTTTVVLWRKRKVLRETGRDVQVTPSADDAVSDTEVNVREITLVTNSGQPQMSDGENPQPAVYENAERLPDKTYDTTCLPYEEHRYSGLQIRTTGSANSATVKDVPDSERKDKTIYYNMT